jgi:uncharacterized protein (TIGR02145 family)
MSIEEQMAYNPSGATDATVYGDLYQWGRPTDGHEKRTSATTTTLSASNTPGHSNFILAPSVPYDWRSPRNDALWGATKTANDPCPAGWRLPTQAEWASIYVASGNTWTWSNTTTPGYKISTDGGTTVSLFLPAAGYRNQGSSTLGNAGTIGYYWSSTPYSTYSYYLYFSSGGVSPGSNYYRANGYSCRCIAEY